MRKTGRIIVPGDPDYELYRHPEHKHYWNRLRAMAGLPLKTGAKIEVDGFFIRDTRVDPPIAIFKNCKFPWKEGKLAETQLRVDEVIAFQNAYECHMLIKSMHLSADDEKKMRITALARDPGLGEPMPTQIIMDEKEFKQR